MVRARQVVAANVAAFNAHDAERIRALYADDVTFEAPGGVRLKGAAAAVEYMMSWLQAFPDGQVTVDTEVADADWVAHRLVFEGTHEETFVGSEGEIPATHRRVRGEGTEFLRVEGGRIVEDYLYFDQVQLLAQLGVMPELAFRR